MMSQPPRPPETRLTKSHYLLTWMNAMQATYNKTTVWSHNAQTGQLVPIEFAPDSIAYHAALANIQDRDDLQEEQSYTAAKDIVTAYNRARRQHEDEQRLQVQSQHGRVEVKHEPGRARAASSPMPPASRKVKQEPSEDTTVIKQESPSAEDAVTTLANQSIKPEQGSFEGHKQSLIYAVEQLRGVLYQREMMKGARKEVDEYLDGLEGQIKKVYDHGRR